ncbi:Uncharacterized protein HZ326_0305 [Fusarium oxysporum f. sp. albedinis]|nr:Uncharacterized protein HZ326_0305 [Fusarium oxysporum f. sp. albedinis]
MSDPKEPLIEIYYINPYMPNYRPVPSRLAQQQLIVVALLGLPNQMVGQVFPQGYRRSSSACWASPDCLLSGYHRSTLQ